MSTPSPQHTPTRPVRPFHTPVRGHAFSTRPSAGQVLERSPLTLRPEPDNPADPYAVAVWADGGGRPWRVGYLERAVAARLVGRLGDPDHPLQATFEGWWEAPTGRWQRPVVRVATAVDAATRLSGTRPAPSAGCGPAAVAR